MMRAVLAAALCAATVGGFGGTDRRPDPRDIENGHKIAAYNYADQPYVVVNRRGEWVCVLTTGRKPEGSRGQFVVSTISADKGKTWSEPVAIEPDDGPEASWATPLIVPSGRIYVFYSYNGDDVTTLPGGGKKVRSDTHGWYVFRYSDDDGRTWSPRRYRIPIRVTDADRRNPWKGEVCHFWGIDKPKVQNGTVYFAFTKLARFFMEEGEGWIAASKNILTEKDPEKIEWTILPDGDHGIRSPALGSIQEEFNLLPLGGDALFAVNRTTNGFIACSYSRDGGRNWSVPEPLAYEPGGRVVKSPRACPKLLAASGGRVLLWYHLNGGHDFMNRNPVFLSAGRLGKDGRMRWSEPELALYSRDASARMSYPDIVEQDGRFWLTETQKTFARVHALDSGFLDGLWNQDACAKAAVRGRLVAARGAGVVKIGPSFGNFEGGGHTVELVFDAAAAKDGEALFEAVGADGRGVRVSAESEGGARTLRYLRRDGATVVDLRTDPELSRKGANHAAFVFDARAGVVLAYVNGHVCDGGKSRDFGFARIAKGVRPLADVSSGGASGSVKLLRLYDRPLRTAEVVGGFRAACGAR